jgi:hypothetical protein
MSHKVAGESGDLVLSEDIQFKKRCRELQDIRPSELERHRLKRHLMVHAASQAELGRLSHHLKNARGLPLSRAIRGGVAAIALFIAIHPIVSTAAALTLITTGGFVTFRAMSKSDKNVRQALESVSVPSHQSPPRRRLKPDSLHPNRLVDEALHVERLEQSVPSKHKGTEDKKRRRVRDTVSTHHRRAALPKTPVDPLEPTAMPSDRSRSLQAEAKILRALLSKLSNVQQIPVGLEEAKQELAMFDATYPNTSFKQERAFLDVLVAVHDDSYLSAEQKAKDFLKHWPNSPYRGQVNDILLHRSHMLRDRRTFD